MHGVFIFTCHEGVWGNTGCRWVVSFTSLPLCPRGKSSQYLLDRRLTDLDSNPCMWQQNKDFCKKNIACVYILVWCGAWGSDVCLFICLCTWMWGTCMMRVHRRGVSSASESDAADGWEHWERKSGGGQWYGNGSGHLQKLSGICHHMSTFLLEDCQVVGTFNCYALTCV